MDEYLNNLFEERSIAKQNRFWRVYEDIDTEISRVLKYRKKESEMAQIIGKGEIE